MTSSEDFKTKLDGLQPSVRKKALKIAQELVKENGYSREKAITEGIKRAEEWFYDLRG